MAIREGKWRCDKCQSENLGRNTGCQACGSHRGKDVKFYLNGDETPVKQEARLKEATAGPDWHCGYCGTNNRNAISNCEQCGCVRDQQQNSKIGMKPIEKDIPKERYGFSPTNYLMIALAICFFWLFVWLHLPVEIEATPIAKSWERTLSTECYKTVREKDWDVPFGGRVVSQSTDVHHYDTILSHYETKTRQVSDTVQTGTETVITGHRDLGNGYFEDIESTRPIYETVYRTEQYEDPVYIEKPVYAEYYVYDIERWIKGESYTTSGTDENPYWADFNATQTIREARRSGNYSISFHTCVDKFEEIWYHTEDEDEWRGFLIGKPYIISRNRIGVIYDIKPRTEK